MISKQVKEATQGLIPSIRAAQLSGYSQDYVGQLCRAGSIECTRVMGEWRVNLESLLAYKKRFNPDFKPKARVDISDVTDPLIPTPVGHKDVFTKGGVEYLSSAEASSITGYSQDYIGQLARSGAVPAEKVGRKWFVAKADLLEHKKHNDSLLVAVQEKSLGVSKRAGKEDFATKNDVISNNIKISKLPQITYKRDDGSTITTMPTATDTLKEQSARSSSPDKSTPIVKVMDLRNTRYRSKNKAISPNLNVAKHTPRVFNDNSIAVRDSSRITKFIKVLLILITLSELVVIACMILIPDIVAGFFASIATKNVIAGTLINWLSGLPYIDNIIDLSKG